MIRRAALVGLAVAFALLGTFLLAATPSVVEGAGAQAAWALFALVLLKVPLLWIVWSMIARHRRAAAAAGPRREDAEVLAARVAREEAAPHADGAGERIAALRAELLAVAGRADGALTAELVALAMRLDRLGRRRPATSPRI